MKKKLILLGLIVTLVTVLSFTFISGNILNAASGGFNVEGTTLYDANGQPFIMRGVNHAHTWYKDQLNTAIPAIAATGSNTVRIVLSNGVQWTYDTAAEVDTILNLCEEYNMIAVLEIHDATGYNDISSLLACAEYFVDIKSVLEGREDTVIINIANEWYGEWATDTWAEGYLQAIPIIRNAGLTHAILVDGAGWGQYPQSIIDRGKDVLAADPQGDVLFAWHGYEYAAGDSETIKNNIDQIVNQNLCLTIGEFGWQHSSGDVDEEYLMSYCQERNVGWLAWSWKGNGGGVEYLDLSYDWAGTDLSDWGNTVVNGTNGLKSTSKICSVFDGSTVPTTTTTTTTTTTNPTTTPSTTTAPTSTEVTATLTITNDWDTGGQANVIVTNNTSSATNGWSVNVTVPGTITNIWGAVGSGSGEVTLTNEAWNSVIQPGNSVECGLIYSK